MLHSSLVYLQGIAIGLLIVLEGKRTSLIVLYIIKGGEKVRSGTWTRD